MSQDISDDDVKRVKDKALPLMQAREQPLGQAPKQARDQALGQPLGQPLGRAREQALKQARERAREQVLKRIHEQAREQTRFLDSLWRAKNAEFWKSVLEDPALHSPPLEMLCDLLNLTTRSQWWEALRLRGLPQVPERITLTDPRVWQRTEEAFARRRAGEADRLHAASQLLFDVWLWFAGCHDNPDQSPFASLAQLTRRVDAPPLRVAHCIRDLAYGDASRAADLIAMVHSTEPAYRTLFEEAFWPQELQGPIRARKKRKR